MAGAFSSAFSSAFDVYQPPQEQANYGYYNLFQPPRKRRVDDDEQDDEKQPVEIAVIGDAPKRQVITGVVMPRLQKPKAGKPDTLINLSKARVEGERARADRIRRNIAASNAWLMTA